MVRCLAKLTALVLSFFGLGKRVTKLPCLRFIFANDFLLYVSDIGWGHSMIQYIFSCYLELDLGIKKMYMTLYTYQLQCLYL